MTGSVLVVEDDDAMRAMLNEELTVAGYTVHAASSGAEALRLMASVTVDVVLTDMVMPGMRGTELMAQVRAREPEIPVVIVTAFGSVEAAVEAVKAGAYHYLSKPVSMEQLVLTIANALRERRLRQELLELREEVGEGRVTLVAQSPPMRKVMELIHRAAAVDTPILLRGESGTGKELVARALHRASKRRTKRFLAVNCSAIPDTLLESQLFGHRRGAFTDARDDSKGLFQETNEGTLLLDEIGDMPLALQGKLLRVIQEREVHPVGAPAPTKVDVRVVAATHRDIEARVRDGTFREDLYYRLNVIAIHLPPLRERADDLIPLVAHFLEKHGKRLARPGCTLSAAALELLRRHPWPGNVRELENAIERALVLGRDRIIRPEELPEAVRSPIAAARPAAPLAALADVERTHILRVLEAVRGNKAKSARILGLDRKTLYRKLRSYGID